ncbi:hypothetical protein M432DRAFT_642769 [Thermoascus aurantiacus ATCC 26904]
MKPATLLSATILALSPLASAWGLHLYDKESYKGGEIYKATGHSSKGCTNLPASARNKAESMHWYSDYELFEVVLYADTGCKNELGKSRGDWHLPAMSSKAKNNIESFKVNGLSL